MSDECGELVVVDTREGRLGGMVTLADAVRSRGAQVVCWWWCSWIGIGGAQSRRRKKVKRAKSGASGEMFGLLAERRWVLAQRHMAHVMPATKRSEGVGER